jgi:hypothetical protein
MLCKTPLPVARPSAGRVTPTENEEGIKVAGKQARTEANLDKVGAESLAVRAYRAMESRITDPRGSGVGHVKFTVSSAYQDDHDVEVERNITDEMLVEAQRKLDELWRN